MKVAAIGPVPPFRGGISHYNASLIGELRRKGHEVLPIGFERLYPKFLFPGSSEIDPASTPLEGAQSMLVPWDPRTWSSARKLLRDFAPDRVVAHHWHPFFVPAMRMVLGAVPASRVDVIAHNVLPHEHGIVGRLFNPFLFRHASRVYVGAKAEETRLHELVPGVEAMFMPHPVYDRFSDEITLERQAEAKRELGYDPGQVLLVHLGLVRKYKGVDILLDAFSRLEQDNLRLEVAGEFYDDPTSYLRQVRTLQLEDRVRLVNQYLTDKEMAIRLRAADAVVLPYRHGTQSGVAMAALAAGVPVIASRVGSLADVVEEGELGCLCDPESVSDLVGAMLRFLRIGIDRWRLGRREIARLTRERYTWSALADRIVREEA